MNLLRIRGVMKHSLGICKLSCKEPNANILNLWYTKNSLIDGKYRCAKYSKIFLYQASATRHGNIDWAKGKKGHKCIVYSKVFPTKSQLEKHKTIHAKLASKNAWNVKDMSEGKHKELCFPNAF